MQDTLSREEVLIREGTNVQWDWGQSKATGTVKEIFESDIEKTISGTTVKREASSDTPAYVIVQDDGQEVLKSSSEVERKQ